MISKSLPMSWSFDVQNQKYLTVLLGCCLLAIKPATWCVTTTIWNSLWQNKKSSEACAGFFVFLQFANYLHHLLCNDYCFDLESKLFICFCNLWKEQNKVKKNGQTIGFDCLIFFIGYCVEFGCSPACLFSGYCGFLPDSKNTLMGHTGSRGASANGCLSMCVLRLAGDQFSNYKPIKIKRSRLP